jgi:hypothetical protein
VLFLGPVELLYIGILDEYIGCIYEEVKRYSVSTLKETGDFTTTSETPAK